MQRACRYSCPATERGSDRSCDPLVQDFNYL